MTSYDWRTLTCNATPVFVTGACCGLIVQGLFSILLFEVVVSFLLYRAISSARVES